MTRDNDRNHRDGRDDQNQAGVLTTPGPDVTRRAGCRRAHGSQRSAVEIFNRQHAEWNGKQFDDEYSVLTDAQARAIRRKIRKALYASDGDFQIRKGTVTYKDAVKKHGFKLTALRRKLDSNFGLLAMAEASWASDMFIQEVFKVDRTYKPAGSNWIHPRNRVSDISAGLALPGAGQSPRISRGRNARANRSRKSIRSSGDLSNCDASSASVTRQVRTNPAHRNVQTGAVSRERSRFETEVSLSDGERSGDRVDTRATAPDKNLPPASPQPKSSRKKRRLRKIIESDEDERDGEEQHECGEHEDDENEDEEELLRKLEEIRKKRARRAVRA